jgi:hypothetical protein
MNDQAAKPFGEHDHIFLGASHAANERGTWAAISLTGFMMVAEIVGGTLFGSLAVVADGFHMATHALALLIAAVAYSYARRHVNDPRFVFGTGKLGDLAGFTSAIVLALIALMIDYEAAVRLFSPVTIRFDEAILIAAGDLIVNIATAWLLRAAAIAIATGMVPSSMDMVGLAPPPPFHATTTCARPLCMWLPTRRSRCSRYAGCSSGAFLAGSGWTRSWVSSEPWSSPIGPLA